MWGTRGGARRIAARSQKPDTWRGPTIRSSGQAAASSEVVVAGASLDRLRGYSSLFKEAIYCVGCGVDAIPVLENAVVYGGSLTVDNGIGTDPWRNDMCTRERWMRKSSCLGCFFCEIFDKHDGKYRELRAHPERPPPH